MFLSALQVDDCIRWLEQNASAPVRYLTHRDILKRDPGSPEMSALWQEVAGGPEADELFSRQNPDGSWFCGGPWGPRGYRQESGDGYSATRPKFVTTAWLLPYLGQMGFTCADERVRRACDFILADGGFGRQFPADPKAESNCCGLAGIPLRALASVGLGADERLQAGWDALVRCQRGDGGWINPRHLPDSPNPSQTVGRWPWDRSCAWGSYYSLEALYYSGAPQHVRPLRSALEFMLWHLSQKDPEHLKTWAYHGHNTVKELLMFSQAGIDMNAAPIQVQLEWLKDLYRPEEGCFRAQARPIADFTRQVSAIVHAYEQTWGKNYWGEISRTGTNVLRYQLYHLAEDDWLTYYAIRIALNLNEKPANDPIF